MGAAAGGALLGAVLGFGKQQEQEEAFRQRAALGAAQTRFSPFTGQDPASFTEFGAPPSLFDNLIEGALRGAKFGQSNFGGQPASPAATDLGGTSTGAELSGQRIGDPLSLFARTA